MHVSNSHREEVALLVFRMGAHLFVEPNAIDIVNGGLPLDQIDLPLSSKRSKLMNKLAS